MHFGEVHEDGTLEQVKGIQYSLPALLGRDSLVEVKWRKDLQDTQTSEYHLYSSQESPTEKKLYHCVFYLAPGDYHGFHAPADMTAISRRHLPGYLIPVRPYVANAVKVIWYFRKLSSHKGLYELNERVAIIGEWQHGAIALVAVGATNVGSISISFDPVCSLVSSLMISGIGYWWVEET